MSQYKVNSFSVSQNFLTSGRLIKRLLDKSSITKDDHVVEIGAGKGHITRQLIARSGNVTAVEIDPRLHSRLCESIGGADNLKLVRGDFLGYNLPSKPYKVFANIPFNITTEIMRKLAYAQMPPSEVWLVMEKGAAKRFMGKPAESAASLMLKPFYDIDVTYHFQREDFHPMPSVDTVLLHMKAT